MNDVAPDHRSGFVAVIGRPNVGKSTLLNRLLEQKIAITSPKPQTTRDQLLGILTLENAQILFLDTPGIHRPEHKLGAYMVGVAEETIEDADVVLWLVDASELPTDEDQAVADILVRMARKRQLNTLVLGLNKIDRPLDEETVAARREQYLALLEPEEGARRSVAAAAVQEVVAFSALTGEGIPALVETLRLLLPFGPRYYPDDQVTDLQTRFIAAELIREQVLRLLQQEVPHSVAVVVDEFEERSPDLTYIRAVIYVERPTQKGIVLGQGGAMIKKIGQAARPEIEELVGTRVYLELWVKVWEKWRRREDMLRRLGYATN
jgi:GTP-binding protein Era